MLHQINKQVEKKKNILEEGGGAGLKQVANEYKGFNICISWSLKRFFEIDEVPWWLRE